MAVSAKKMLGLVLWAFTCTLAVAQEEQLTKTLQPQGLDYTGIYALRQIEPDLTGAGVKLAVVCRSITYIDGEPQNDYRPNTRHNCFSDTRFTFHDSGQLAAGVSPHSTAVCSILFGADSNAFDPQLGQFGYQGTVPAADAQVYEFWHFLINHVFSQSPPDADILTASIGNQFENWWTRGIESLAENGLIVVAGIGNGSDAYDPLLYPGAGTNVIGVGVVDCVNTENLAASLKHFSLPYPEHSSCGPTMTGRCKPDIVAPGNCLAAHEAIADLYEPTGNWSSFSTPIVAGTIGLLVQKAKQNPELSLAVSPEGGNCVIKAIVMNSATKLPYWHKGRLEKDDDHLVPLDYVQGAGMLNALEAYRHLLAGRNEPNEVPNTGWDLNKLQKAEASESIYKISVAGPANKMITVTAVWNKHYQNEYPFEPIPAKDANLRLELWAIDSKDPNNDYLLDYSDSSSDNVEHVYHKADPNYTDYEIVIGHSDTYKPNELGEAQSYGLAWNVSEATESDNILWYDLNTDGIVNESDVAVLIENLLTSLKTPGGYELGDINADGSIDMKDTQILLDHRNQQADWYGENSKNTN